MGCGSQCSLRQRKCRLFWNLFTRQSSSDSSVPVVFPIGHCGSHLFFCGRNGLCHSRPSGKGCAPTTRLFAAQMLTLFVYSTLENRSSWTIFRPLPLFNMRPPRKSLSGLVDTAPLKPIAIAIRSRILFCPSRLDRQLLCIWFSVPPRNYCLRITTPTPFVVPSPVFPTVKPLPLLQE